jgi:hypothetical protein
MEDDQVIEEIALIKLMRLNAPIVGVVTGLVMGGAIFVATLYLILKGGDVVGPHLALLGQYFIGYTVTVPGSFVGLAYGFVTGFVIGYVVARLYNWLAHWRENRR